MITEKDLDLIEAYQANSANPEQTKEVERRMQEDSTFRMQVEIMKELPSAVKADVESFSSDLDRIMSEGKLATKAKTRQLPLRKVLLALAASIVFVLAINFLLTDSVPTDLYASYFSLPAENISVRSNTDQDEILTAGLEAYSANQYAAANEKFKSFLARQPGHQGARFFYSLSLMADSHFVEAQTNLLLLQDDSGAYQNAVIWYLGLIQLKLGRTAEAMPYFTTLANQANSYQAKAKEILNAID